MCGAAARREVTMRIEIARAAASHLQQRREELLHDLSLPLSVRGSANVHFEKPWIDGFWSVAIKYPSGSGDPSYLDFEIGRADGSPWYFPSRQWWIAHARASHPPDGSGCDALVHTDFLSREGKTHEFDYATILLDRRLIVLGRHDFDDECAWWRRAFSA
jgi:hypothetical protein